MQQDAIHSTKTMTLEERYAILQEQMSAMVDRLAETEKRLDLERVTRAEILEKEREDLLNQEREKIRVALMSEFEGMKKEIGEKAKELRLCKANDQRRNFERAMNECRRLRTPYKNLIK